MYRWREEIQEKTGNRKAEGKGWRDKKEEVCGESVRKESRPGEKGRKRRYRAYDGGQRKGCDGCVCMSACRMCSSN